MTGSYITLKSLSEADNEEDIVAYYFPDSYKNVSGKKDDEKMKKAEQDAKEGKCKLIVWRWEEPVK